MKDSKATVKENREVARDTYLMILEGDFPLSIPGQFAMIQIDCGNDPFLRRPLAILGQKDTELEFLYKVKGKGTMEMSRKRKGDMLSILGPLGKGFSTPQKDESVVYIAGGTGVPPIIALAEQQKKGYLIVGARSKEDFPLRNRISNIQGIHVRITTEDGSLGQKGLATDVLDEILASISIPCIVYACGPNAMLKKISEQARRIGARCEVSLEEHMACGFGVCSACAVKTVTGNQRVCLQGPVFDAMLIQWSS